MDWVRFENDSFIPEGECAKEYVGDDDEPVGAGAVVQPDGGERHRAHHVEHEADEHAQRRPRAHVQAGHAHTSAIASSRLRLAVRVLHRVEASVFNCFWDTSVR